MIFACASTRVVWEFAKATQEKKQWLHGTLLMYCRHCYLKRLEESHNSEWPETEDNHENRHDKVVIGRGATEGRVGQRLCVCVCVCGVCVCGGWMYVHMSV